MSINIQDMYDIMKLKESVGAKMSSLPLPQAYSAIGWVASLLSILLFIPQAMQAFVTKATDDISTLTILAISVGDIFWIIYGAGINSFQLISSASIQGLIGFAIVLFKYRQEISEPIMRLIHRKK